MLRIFVVAVGLWFYSDVLIILTERELKDKIYRNCMGLNSNMQLADAEDHCKKTIDGWDSYSENPGLHK